MFKQLVNRTCESLKNNNLYVRIVTCSNLFVEITYGVQSAKRLPNGLEIMLQRLKNCY